MDKQDYILKYLHGELADEEYASFIQLTETDPSFAEDVKLESILYAKHKHDIKRQLMAHVDHEKSDKLVEVDPNIKNRSKLLRFIRNSAAIFILGIAAYFLFIDQSANPVDSSALASSYLTEYHKAPANLRSESDIDIDPWTIATQSYEQGKFELAIEQIELIPIKTNEQNLYLALSQLYAEPKKNVDIAISYFNTVLSNDNKLHSDEAQWFLSLALLLKNEKEKAIDHLNQIIAEKNWNSDKAKDLLEAIDKL